MADRNLNIVSSVLAKSMSFDKPLRIWLDDGRVLEGVPTHHEIDRNLKPSGPVQTGFSNILIRMPGGEAFHLMRVQRLRWLEGPPPR